MKTGTKVAMLLMVLGFCLPCSGEILVYKFTQKATYYWQEGETWAQEKGTYKGYLVVDVNYTDGTIEAAKLIEYGSAGGNKWYVQYDLDFELVRVDLGSKVQWVVVVAEIEEAGGGLHMLSGLARNRSVGTGENKEVANTLTGYGLEASAEEGSAEVGMSTLSATLYPAWTNWANGEGKGGQDFDTTVEMIIVDYLVPRGYVEELDD